MSTGGTTPHTSANAAVIAAEAAKAFDLKAEGKTVREIAGIMNLAPTTVQRRIQAEIDSRVSPRVEDYRALQDQQIDNSMTVVRHIIMDPTADTELRLKAIDRQVKLMDRQAKLHGTDAPVKIEGTMVHKTELESELDALFAQQDQANEQAAKQVSEASS